MVKVRPREYPKLLRKISLTLIKNRGNRHFTKKKEEMKWVVSTRMVYKEKHEGIPFLEGPICRMNKRRGKESSDPPRCLRNRLRFGLLKAYDLQTTACDRAG